MPRLLLATNNPHKVAEFRDLLANCGWELVSPADVGLRLEVEESGATYTENASIKALAFARASDLPALADDSGLEVDALKGEPGPLHHVHGWDGADNKERIAILLERLRGVPLERRTARFRAVIAIAFPSGDVHLVEGSCEGIIAEKARGEAGFGYDPVFLVTPNARSRGRSSRVTAGQAGLLPELGRTMAELSTAEKNRVSHRAAAAQKAVWLLRSLAPGREE